MATATKNANRRTSAPAAAGSKDGKAANAQDSADQGALGSTGTHQIAEGHNVSVRGKDRGPGYRVSAADFATKRDPDGTQGLQRLIDGGELIDSGEERAGGGSIDNGGATGAGPSAAQITAADNGDEGSKAVVNAALTGTEGQFTAAATPDGEGEPKA